MTNECLPKLLRAIAGSENAKAARHDVIFNAAADEIEHLRHDVERSIANHSADLTAADGPTQEGTPLCRLATVVDFTVERGLCTGIEAKPPELFLMEAYERLRAALLKIVSEAESDDGLTAWDGADIAREALNTKK